MGITIRRTRAVIRKFDSSQAYWHDARVVADEKGGATLITYWRNPELAGIWEFRYNVPSKCFLELHLQGLIQHDGSKDQNSFILSLVGRQRLSQS